MSYRYASARQETQGNASGQIDLKKGYDRNEIWYGDAAGADRVFDISEGESDLMAFVARSPFDLVFELSGAPAGFAAIRCVRRGGTVIQVGNLPGGQIPVPANAVMAKELALMGTFRFGNEFGRAVDLIASGAINVSRLVTAEFSLNSASDAFRLALGRSRSVKVLLSASAA